jgi:hypothetical protein
VVGRVLPGMIERGSGGLLFAGGLSALLIDGPGRSRCADVPPARTVGPDSIDFSQKALW